MAKIPFLRVDDQHAEGDISVAHRSGPVAFAKCQQPIFACLPHRLLSTPNRTFGAMTANPRAAD
jgi:hypothetical protein